MPMVSFVMVQSDVFAIAYGRNSDNLKSSVILEPPFCMIHQFSRYRGHQQTHWAGLGPPCPDDVSSDRYYMHNKGIFSHVIILPCQTGCYEDCIFLETSRHQNGERLSSWFRWGGESENVKQWKRSFATDNVEPKNIKSHLNCTRTYTLQREESK
jgi:hypothetical protein